LRRLVVVRAVFWKIGSSSLAERKTRRKLIGSTLVNYQCLPVGLGGFCKYLIFIEGLSGPRLGNFRKMV
jgi:hypothetical protein